MGKVPLYCDDCNVEIFVDVNMVMIKDELWEKICSHTRDAYCDCCIEKRLGRPIAIEDFKPSSMGMSIIPCNAWWLQEQQEKGKIVEMKAQFAKPPGIGKAVMVDKIIKEAKKKGIKVVDKRFGDKNNARRKHGKNN